MGLYKFWDKPDYEAFDVEALYEMLSSEEQKVLYNRLHEAITDCSFCEMLEVYSAFLQIKGREKEIEAEQKSIKEEIINYLEQ